MRGAVGDFGCSPALARAVAAQGISRPASARTATTAWVPLTWQAIRRAALCRAMSWATEQACAAPSPVASRVAALMAARSAAARACAPARTAAATARAPIVREASIPITPRWSTVPLPR